MHLYVGHEYKPVGQGLFAYGNLKMLHTPKGKRHIKYAGQAPDWEFHWVYDCGSSSGQTLVNRGIQDIASKLNGKSLDLVVISHLHFDHISGLLELLRKVPVKSIMLPWAPLWQRLLIGFEQGLSFGSVKIGWTMTPLDIGRTGDRFCGLKPRCAKCVDIPPHRLALRHGHLAIHDDRINLIAVIIAH